MIDFKEFQALTADLRAKVLEEVEAHEKEFHGGAECVATRLGIVAFMAHSLGFGVQKFDARLTSLFTFIREYEANCPCLIKHKEKQ